MIFKVEKTFTTLVDIPVSDEDVKLIKKDFLKFYVKYSDKFNIDFSEQKEVKEELNISTKAFN